MADVSEHPTLLPVLPESWRRNPAYRRWSGWAVAALLAVIFAYGFAQRLAMYQGDEGQQLWPDVVEYRDLAQRMTNFYGASKREPLHVAIIKLFGECLGYDDQTMRLSSLVFSPFPILLAFGMGAWFFGRYVGLVAALFVSTNTMLILNSAEGMRLELFTTLLLLYLWLTFGPRRPSWRAALGAGVVGGLLCLTRITSLSFIAPALAWIALCRFRKPARWRWAGAAVLSGVVTAALLAPFLVSCAKTYGDPLYSINHLGGRWAQMETGRERKGLSAFDLILHGRPPLETLWEHWDGYREIYRRSDASAHPTWRWFSRFSAIGWLMVLVTRMLWMGVIWFFALLPVAWATHVLPVDRLYAHVYPLHAICIGVGLNPLAYGLAAVVRRTVGRWRLRGDGEQT